MTCFHELEFAKFLIAQMHAIDKSVYIASEKANQNLRLDENGQPTQQFIIQWVKTHAESFKKAWNSSACKDCKKINSCYDCLKDSCPFFE